MKKFFLLIYLLFMTNSLDAKSHWRKKKKYRRYSVQQIKPIKIAHPRQVIKTDRIHTVVASDRAREQQVSKDTVDIDNKHTMLSTQESLAQAIVDGRWDDDIFSQADLMSLVDWSNPHKRRFLQRSLLQPPLVEIFSYLDSLEFFTLNNLKDAHQQWTNSGKKFSEKYIQEAFSDAQVILATPNLYADCWKKPYKNLLNRYILLTVPMGLSGVAGATRYGYIQEFRDILLPHLEYWSSSEEEPAFVMAKNILDILDGDPEDVYPEVRRIAEETDFNLDYFVGKKRQAEEVIMYFLKHRPTRLVK